MLPVEEASFRSRSSRVSGEDLRFKLMNVWEPILTSICDHSLAVAESLPVEEQDEVKVKRAFPHAAGEACAVKCNSEHRFWY